MPSLLLVACDGKVTNAFLQEHRFRVSTAQSMAEALTKVHSTRYDFILFSSPPNNDVMQNVRTAKPNVRARVIVAGISDEGVHQRGWAGVVALGPTSSPEAMARA